MARERAQSGVPSKRSRPTSGSTSSSPTTAPAKPTACKIYINGEIQEVDRPTDKLEGTIKTKVPFKIGQRSKGSSLEKTGLQDVRIYSRVLAADEVMALKDKPRLAYLVTKPALQRTEEEQKALFDGYLNGYDPNYIAVAKASRCSNRKSARSKSAAPWPTS